MEIEVYRRMREIEDSHWWFVARRKIIKEMLVSLNLPSHGRILDVGCGTGGNLALLSEFGDVTGLEMNPVAAEMARERHACRVILGSLPDHIPEKEERFGLVTLFDVLEHIDRDLDSLTAVRQMLLPGGSVLMTVPAFPFLWSAHDDRHQHKRRYLKAELIHVMRQAGLRPVYVTYYNTWLFPLVLAVRLAKRLLGSEESDEERAPPVWLNKLLAMVFGSERHLLGRMAFPFGVSLLALGRRD